MTGRVILCGVRIMARSTGYGIEDRLGYDFRPSIFSALGLTG